MTKVLSLTVFLSLAILTSAKGQDDSFGLGLIVGNPTGISGKLWLDQYTALDAAAAWSFGNRRSFHLHGDYLFHRFDLIRVQKGRVPVHVGIGARTRIGKDDRLGIRGVVGLTYLFEDSPLDVFFEMAPILDLAPNTDFDLNAGIGVRYFF